MRTSLFLLIQAGTQQSFHLFLAIVKRKFYWPILTLSQGGGYISQKLTIFVSKLNHQNFNAVLWTERWSFQCLLLTVDLKIMYFTQYFWAILLAIIMKFSMQNYCLCKPEEISSEFSHCTVALNNLLCKDIIGFLIFIFFTGRLHKAFEVLQLIFARPGTGLLILPVTEHLPDWEPRAYRKWWDQSLS